MCVNLFHFEQEETMHNKNTLLSSSQTIIFLCFMFLFPSLVLSQVGTVTLGMGNGFGEPGSTDNPVEISLDNQGDRATSLQCDVCRGDNLTLSACESTVRTTGINCAFQDLGNGCDRILAYSLGGDFIESGTGPVLTLNYDVATEAPQGTCHGLTLANVLIPECLDDGMGGCVTGPPFENVSLENGEFCFLFVDSDDDGIPDDGDNSGTVGDNPCTGGQTAGCDDNCFDAYNPNQHDTYPPQGNGIGDTCDCECDFDCDSDVDADDVETFLADFGRFQFNNPCANDDPCNGDSECDTDVDADDVDKFLEDFGRFQFNNPCPACVVGDWCVYP